LLQLFAEKILHAKRSVQIIEIRYLWSSFNDFAIKNFTSFIAMTLIIATKPITAVFGTMSLQFIEEFQCSETYSLKETSSFFNCCNAFIDFIVYDCSFNLTAAPWASESKLFRYQ